MKKVTLPKNFGKLKSEKPRLVMDEIHDTIKEANHTIDVLEKKNKKLGACVVAQCELLDTLEDWYDEAKAKLRKSKVILTLSIISTAIVTFVGTVLLILYKYPNIK